jgi:NADH-quinone oxidoreductase subunit N
MPDFRVIAPELILTVTAFAIILWELVTRTRNHMPSAGLASLGAISALVITFSTGQMSVSTFSDTIVLDPFASFFKVIFLFGLILSIALSLKQVSDSGSREHSEYYALMIFATVGMMVMATGRELITVFLGLELLSMSLYILAGFFRRDTLSNEAALKYFVLGSFATGILLFGMSYIYGATGSTHLQVIGETLRSHPEALSNKALLVGLFMVLVGFGFKISVVPFHQWTPDVYQGAPTPVTAFMSAGPKAAGLAALIRILMEAMPQMGHQWEILVAVLRRARRTHHDGGKPCRPCPDQYQEDARLLIHCSCGLYPHRPGGFGGRQGRQGPVGDHVLPARLYIHEHRGFRHTDIPPP